MFLHLSPPTVSAAFSRLLSVGRVRWMSVRPPSSAASSDPPALSQKVTLAQLYRMKQQHTPITMLTAYDYPTARQCESRGVDIVLVGDSLAQVCLGYESTTRLTLNEMLHHVKAVARGSKNPLLVADMPFGSYQGALTDTINNAVRLMQEGGAESVKLEGGEEIVPIVSALTRIGIPVMAHIGLLPQRHVSLSGYKVQGRSAGSAQQLLRAACALCDAGSHAIVLEAIPAALGGYISSKIDIPTIGIGAGPRTDGQVLVIDDAMGIWDGHKAKFVRRFADAKSTISDGIDRYIEAVKSRSFPDESESYSMPEVEWKRFLEMDAVKEFHSISQVRMLSN